MPKVTKALIFLFIPVYFQISSSTVSLAGNTQRGDAVNTAKKRAKFPYSKSIDNKMTLTIDMAMLF